MKEISLKVKNVSSTADFYVQPSTYEDITGFTVNSYTEMYCTIEKIK
jgi:hypothetical protein